MKKTISVVVAAVVMTCAQGIYAQERIIEWPEHTPYLTLRKLFIVESDVPRWEHFKNVAEIEKIKQALNTSGQEFITQFLQDYDSLELIPALGGNQQEYSRLKQEFINMALYTARLVYNKRKLTPLVIDNTQAGLDRLEDSWNKLWALVRNEMPEQPASASLATLTTEFGALKLLKKGQKPETKNSAQDEQKEVLAFEQKFNNEGYNKKDLSEAVQAISDLNNYYRQVSTQIAAGVKDAKLRNLIEELEDILPVASKKAVQEPEMKELHEYEQNLEKALGDKNLVAAIQIVADINSQLNHMMPDISADVKARKLRSIIIKLINLAKGEPQTGAGAGSATQAGGSEQGDRKIAMSKVKGKQGLKHAKNTKSSQRKLAA